ncbi:MAG: hypothetical protein MI747_19355 [Desulfobacterales bacterium]|nr:hypothetical protein [Desulfobacterales bacterium]
MMKRLKDILVYFFTPEDSTRTLSQGGDLTFSINAENLNLGSLKALFWVGATSLFFYLLTLI